MSKIFYDHLINVPELSALIKANTETQEEREELWSLVDEIIHHRVMGCIFDYLPEDSHEEFVEKMSETPFDESLLTYLNDKIKTNIEQLITYEAEKVVKEIIQELLEE